MAGVNKTKHLKCHNITGPWQRLSWVVQAFYLWCIWVRGNPPIKSTVDHPYITLHITTPFQLCVQVPHLFPRYSTYLTFSAILLVNLLPRKWKQLWLTDIDGCRIDCCKLSSNENNVWLKKLPILRESNIWHIEVLCQTDQLTDASSSTGYKNSPMLTYITSRVSNYCKK